MNVSIQKPADTRDLTKKLSELYAQYVLWKIGGLACPAEQKHALLSAVIALLAEPP